MSLVGSDTRTDFRPHVRLFTDGACIDNPGPGGWAFILRHPASDREKESSGGEHNTTNNRMEILAVIRGLEALKAPSDVELFSDSQYVINAITQWMPKWKRFGWKKSLGAKHHIKNADLWRRLDELLLTHRVTAAWVKGHVGHVENERCDKLADAAARETAKAPPSVDDLKRNQTFRRLIFRVVVARAGACPFEGVKTIRRGNEDADGFHLAISLQTHTRLTRKTSCVLVSSHSASAHVRGGSPSSRNSTWMMFGLQQTGQSSTYFCSEPPEGSTGTTICSPQVGQM